MKVDLEKGFTLIELMITVAIVAILAAIAYPSYTQYVLRSHRTDARVALMQDTQALEKCFTVHGAYNDAACTVATTSESGYYTIATSNLSATTFKLTATATGTQTSDSTCANLSIDQSGSKSATTYPDCWTK